MVFKDNLDFNNQKFDAEEVRNRKGAAVTTLVFKDMISISDLEDYHKSYSYNSIVKLESFPRLLSDAQSVLEGGFLVNEVVVNCVTLAVFGKFIIA